jgi:hypothetical protein
MPESVGDKGAEAVTMLVGEMNLAISKIGLKTSLAMFWASV